jgi:hypothetical protein
VVLEWRARDGALARESLDMKIARGTWASVAVLAGAGALVGWGVTVRAARAAESRALAAAAAARGAAMPASAANAADTKIVLFDGKSLAGWKQFLGDEKADPAKTWSVSDGLIHCTGTPAGYLRTEKSFKNYFLVVEWRWPAEPGNSGVLVHVQVPDHVWPRSIEAQLEHGNAGDFWLVDGATANVDESRRQPNKINVKHLKDAEYKVGEWNRYEITCLDGNIVLVVNGELMNVARNANPNEGFILLQSEGKPIDFRKVELTPIP